MVQVPKLDRIQPVDNLPANDRINFQAQNQASNILGRVNAVESVGKKVGDIYQQYENDKIDSISTENELEFNSWNQSKLEELKRIEGDPTDAYAKYDEEVLEKQKEILERRPDLSERVKRHVTSRFDTELSKQRIHALKQQGMQQEVYKNNIYEADLKTKRNGLAINASYINKDDDSSFLPFEQNIADIKTVIAKRGIDKGTVEILPDDAKTWTHSYRDDEGKLVKVSMTPLAKQKVAEEVSQGLKSSLEAMIDSGQVEEAKMLREKYKGYLDPKGEASISKKLKSYDEKNAAYDFMSTIASKPPGEQLKDINNVKDAKLKSELLKIYDTDQARIESIRKRREKNSYEYLSRIVDQKQNGETPFYGVADFEEDKNFKKTWQYLNAEQRQAIQEKIVQPKVSRYDSLNKVQSLFAGEQEIEGMSQQDFDHYLVGLNRTDRNKYQKMFTKLKDPTATEERSMNKRGAFFLQEQMLKTGLIKKDNYNKISGKNEITLIEAREELINFMDNQGKMDDKRLQDFVKSYVKSKVEGTMFQPPERQGYKQTEVPVYRNEKTTNNQSVSGNNYSSLPVNKQIELRRKWKEGPGKGQWPSVDDPKFLQFVKTN